METAQIYTPSNSVQGFPFTTSLTTLTIFLLITATLTGMRGYLFVVLIGIFLVTGDAEHLLMCLLVMCVFLGKYLFRSYRLENFSAIVYSSKFSASFFLSSPSGTPIMWILVSLILPQRSLYHHFENSFFCWVWVVTTTLSSVDWHVPLYHLILIPTSVFF